VQDVAERSRLKSEMLQGYGDAVLRAEALKDQLVKLLTVKIRQPSHEFTFGVGITFVSYSLVLTPVV
jgi:hypothetical protein